MSENKTIQQLEKIKETFNKVFHDKDVLLEELIEITFDMKETKTERRVDQNILMKGSKQDTFPDESKYQLEKRIKQADSKLQTLKKKKEMVQNKLEKINEKIYKLLNKEKEQQEKV